ncbi:hypothetical protein MKX01_019755 [Papaver californicum]|nr:hypothetical protein MKX01_019755 [Papaver californicum]
MWSWVVSASPSSLFSPPPSSSTLHPRIKTPRNSSSLSHLKLSNLLEKVEFRKNGAVTHCSSRNNLVGVAAPASSVRHARVVNLTSSRGTIRAQASNVSIGSPDYDRSEESGDKKITKSDPPSKPKLEKPLDLVPYMASITAVLLGCASFFLLISFVNGGPSALLAVIAKSGFTAAFTLIFVSEIGDKTFFIAALLAMQYVKGLVLLGSMGALSLMTVLSVIIGRVFQSVPAQFQTTLPVGEYTAVALLMFFGLKALKDAWDLPSKVTETSENSTELGEYVEAEELVKEKSPWGVAAGAMAGHLLATLVAIIGWLFGGLLFLVFAGATLLGNF